MRTPLRRCWSPVSKRGHAATGYAGLPGEGEDVSVPSGSNSQLDAGVEMQARNDMR